MVNGLIHVANPADLEAKRDAAGGLVEGLSSRTDQGTVCWVLKQCLSDGVRAAEDKFGVDRTSNEHYAGVACSIICTLLAGGVEAGGVKAADEGAGFMAGIFGGLGRSGTAKGDSWLSALPKKNNIMRIGPAYEGVRSGSRLELN